MRSLHAVTLFVMAMLSGPAHAADTTRLSVSLVCDLKSADKSGSGNAITVLGRNIWHAHGQYLDYPGCEKIVPLQFPKEEPRGSGFEQFAPQTLGAQFASSKGSVYCVCTGTLVATSGLDYLLLEKVHGCFASDRPPTSGR